MKKIIVILGYLMGTTIPSQISACATCLAKLKRNDKPFFIRQISAQIAAAQETVHDARQTPPTHQAEHKKNHSARTNK